MKAANAYWYLLGLTVGVGASTKDVALTLLAIVGGAVGLSIAHVLIVGARRYFGGGLAQ